MGKRGGNGAKASGKFSWDWKARHILTDRFVLADFAKIMGIAGGGLTILVGSVVLFQGDWDAAWRVAVFALAMTCVVALLFLLIMLIIGGKFRYCFEIDDKAVTFTMLSGFVKSGNRLAVILGALARSPGTVGAGLLAKSEEYNFSPSRISPGSDTTPTITWFSYAPATTSSRYAFIVLRSFTMRLRTGSGGALRRARRCGRLRILPSALPWSRAESRPGLRRWPRPA